MKAMPVINSLYMLLRRNQRGTSTIEIAIALPLLLILFYGGLEFSRYIQVTQKVERTISTIADIITQASSTSPINAQGVEMVFGSAFESMSPYPIVNGYGVVTDIVANSSGTPVIQWQCIEGSGGWTSFYSKVGSYNSGTAPTLPGTFTMVPNEEVLVGELYYTFYTILNLNTSLISNAINGSNLYRTAIYAPRFGSISTMVKRYSDYPVIPGGATANFQCYGPTS